MIAKKLFYATPAIVLSLAFLVLCTYQRGFSQDTGKPQLDHVQKGVSAFEEAFYDLAPAGKDAEASRKYGQAIEEFRKAIEIDEKNVEAHLRLARVYYVQKRFSEAAEEYRKVTELTPHDVNAYLKLALTYERLGRYSDAIEQLEKAKTYADNRIVSNVLSDLIEKLRNAK